MADYKAEFSLCDKFTINFHTASRLYLTLSLKIPSRAQTDCKSQINV
jgi:hypothetical protein